MCKIALLVINRLPVSLHVIRDTITNYARINLQLCREDIVIILARLSMTPFLILLWNICSIYNIQVHYICFIGVKYVFYFAATNIPLQSREKDKELIELNIV